LLQRLRQPGQVEAWDRFTRLYTPLLLSWAHSRLNLQPADAEDLVNDLLADLLVKLPDFRYDPGRSFRAWLATLLHHKWVDRQRKAGRLAGATADGLSGVAAAPAPDPLEAEDRRLLIRRALELIQGEFEPKTWKACWEVAAEGRRPAEVAAELGTSENAVYIAKLRVLRRLRRELEGLLD
jgi:RNA polymerase sigma-70 factor (ECF subfamily)